MRMRPPPAGSLSRFEIRAIIADGNSGMRTGQARRVIHKPLKTPIPSPFRT